MQHKFIVLWISAIIGFVTCATAQSLVGTAYVDGEKVEIYDDFSWAFADPLSTNCTAVSKHADFCGNTALWRSFDPNSPEISAAYTYGENYYAMIISEGLGLADGVTAEAMQRIAIVNAAAGAGTTAENIPVLSIESTDFSGESALNTIYVAEIESLKLIYSNTIIVRENTSHQLITYTLGTQMSAEHDGVHDDFLAAVKLK